MVTTGQYGSYPSLRDRTIVVTGGASGIGEAIVAAFAAQKSQVAFLDLQVEAGERLVARLAASSASRPLFLPCDLTDIAALQATLRKIEEQFGTVDVLVNNAANDTRHSIEQVTSQSWDQSIAVNLKHQFFMSQGVIPGMRKTGRGSIINMGSITWAVASTNVPVYATAKAAGVGMTKTLAREVGKDNIRVNCVMPGAVLTERQERLWLTDEYKAKILEAQALKRLILPEEVARLILFLASDDSSAITNQSYIIDGGWI
jgi:NAD(P)-dependent dehydrogenase (short-subunit alcohol dehydrogenase family)